MNAKRPSSSLTPRSFACARSLRVTAYASALRLLAAGCASACVALAGACASAPAVVRTAAITPERLYPMVEGSAWSYDVDTGDGSSVLAISRVTKAHGAQVTVQGGEGATHYELRPDGIFRADRGGYLLKGPIRARSTWPSGSGMQATIQRIAVAIDVPAGRFNDCIEVLEQGSASGAVITTTYCPGVGPVQVVSSMQLQLGKQIVRVVARLRGYRVGPEVEPRPAPEAGSGPARQ